MNPEPIRTIHGKHADAHIIYDDGAGSSPREWSNIGTIAMQGRRNSFIDGQHGDVEYGDLYDQLLDMLDLMDVDTSEDLRERFDHPDGPDDQLATKDAIWDAVNEHYAMLAIQFRDYGSGRIKIWADGDFDECDGIVYVPMRTARTEFPDEDDEGARKMAEKNMEIEVRTYGEYLNGAVFGIVIERDGEHEDSCFGFYGDPHEEGEYIEREAREMLASVDNHLARRYIHDPMNMTPFGGRHGTYV